MDILIIKVDVNVFCFKLKEGVLWLFVVNRILFYVLFKLKCLKKLISDYCLIINVVLRIVYYVWFLKKEMNFYYFLSFISVLRYIKLCFFLVYGDGFLGLYWKYIVVIVNNVIYVKMNFLLIIYNKIIGFI